MASPQNSWGKASKRRRVAYKSDLAMDVLAAELLAKGYAGYIQTGDPNQYHAVIGGEEYAYFDEPEEWAVDNGAEKKAHFFSDWLHDTGGGGKPPRLVVWHSPTKAKELGYWQEFDLMGLETYPLTYGEAIGAFFKVLWFRSQTSRPLVGVIRTFSNGDQAFPTPAFVRFQEGIWRIGAGRRLFAIAHFVWAAPEQEKPPGNMHVLKHHPECWPDQL